MRFPLSGPFTRPPAFRAVCNGIAAVCSGLRRLAHNHAAGPRSVALSLATNVSLLGDEEWKLLAPYGATDYWHEEKPGQYKKYSQVFTRGQADKMEAACNALRDRKGDHWRGLPIYVGHPDVDPKRWPDDGRLGGIMALSAREDGLYVQTAWNDRGLANKAQAYHVFPSPTWLYPAREAQRTGRIEPDELRSVGLTNTPRITDVPAWTNADDSPADPALTTTAKDDDDMNTKALLTKALGMPETATEEEIQTAYNAAFPGETRVADLRTTATNAETARTTAVTEKTEAETRLTAANAATVKYRRLASNTLLDTAITRGVLTAADRPAFEAKFEADFDGAAAELAKRPPALNTQALNLRRDERDLSTPALRSAAYNAFIDERTRPAANGGKGLTIDQAMNEMRVDPVGKAIIAAMDAASQTKAA